MLAVKYLFLLISLTIVITLSVINMEDVPLHYYTLSFEQETVMVPLVVVVVLSASLGFLISWLLGTISALRGKIEGYKQKKEIKEKGSELEEFKIESAIPKSLERGDKGGKKAEGALPQTAASQVQGALPRANR